MAFYLVCDGGGSKTDFLLFNDTAEVLAYVRLGQSNPNFVNIDAAAETVWRGIQLCTQQAGITPAQLTGIALSIPAFAPAIEALGQRLGRGDILHSGDVDSAFFGALGLPFGIVALSGTGSFAAGRSKSGTRASCGGWGPLFGDEGSGYHIGIMCLQRITLRYDSGLAGGVLEALCLGHLGFEKPEDLRMGMYNSDFKRSDIATLAVVAETAAKQGDADALEIWDAAGLALARQVQTIAGRLGDESLPVSLTGGVARAGGLLAGPFEKHLARLCPGFPFVPEKYPPIVGAALCYWQDVLQRDITEAGLAEKLADYERRKIPC